MPAYVKKGKWHLSVEGHRFPNSLGRLAQRAVAPADGSLRARMPNRSGRLMAGVLCSAPVHPTTCFALSRAGPEMSNASPVSHKDQIAIDWSPDVHWFL